MAINRRLEVRKRATRPGGKSTGGLEGCRILVVEDNDVNQELMLGILEHAGLCADVVADGKQALAALERNDYEIILMDCQMPVMDGFEATTAIRHRQDHKSRIPILALTAHAMKGDRERCLAVGMDDYLTKPIERKLLLAKIREWVISGCSSVSR